MSRSMISWIDQKFYPHDTTRWDDALFRQTILSYLKPEHRLLDLGAGAGIIPAMNFRGIARHVCGLDPDPRVLDNPHLNEAQIGLGEQIPWADETFDIVIADNVLEHLTEPVRVFREIQRVLKSGGIFLFKTPNRKHYIPFIARITPTGFHKFCARLRGRSEEDTFPTVYLANRPAAIRKIAAEAGLNVRQISFFEKRPEYMRISVLSYIVGLGYERFVNSSSYLSDWRILIVGELQKRADTPLHANLVSELVSESSQ